ncbi:MAG: hypothetical protein M0R77_13385 [Gammaproteobacteria bacterium]|nr:hypothetical protein [Gammaproteobacteria bacterium]
MKSLAQRVAITLAAIGMVTLAALGTVDRHGFDYTEQGLRRALVTFAVARGLNGVISVAQGTEVAVQPAGVGVNFAPGQILDPVNDLVEQFSWVMLASATSLGLQRLLIEVFATPIVSLLLGALALVLLIFLWRPRLSASPWRNRLLRLTLAMALLRFAVPAVAFGSEGIYALFLAERYEASTQAIEQAADAIARINSGTAAHLEPPADESVVDKAKRWYDAAAAAVDVSAYVERYQTAAADVSEQIVNLTVVFVVQTIALPLLFLWGVMKAVRRLLSAAPAQRETR